MIKLLFSTLAFIFLFTTNLAAQLPAQPEDISPLLAGETIPNITLSALDGKTVNFREIAKNKPTVLVFYRGGWCPYCNRHLAALGQMESEVLRLGYQIVAVSPDEAKRMQETVEKDSIKYQLYSDANGDFAKSIGIAFAAPERYSKMLGEWSGDQNKGFLPVPSVFVLDTSGQILYEHISPNYKQRLSGDLLLAVLKANTLEEQNIVSESELLIAESLKKWKNASAYTLELAAAMPQDKFDFKPVEGEMSFGEQLDHIGQNMTWLAGDYLKGEKFKHPLQDKKERTPAETIELLTASLAFAEEAIANTSPDSLSIVKEFFAGPMSRRQIIALMHDHHTHHRGQLIVYLRLNGIKPPKYRGW